MDVQVLHAMYFHVRGIHKVRGIYTTSSWERENTGCAVYIRCALSTGKYGNCANFIYLVFKELRQILKKMRMRIWSGIIWLGMRSNESFENHKEPMGFVNGRDVPVSSCVIDCSVGVLPPCVECVYISRSCLPVKENWISRYLLCVFGFAHEVWYWWSRIFWRCWQMELHWIHEVANKGYLLYLIYQSGKVHCAEYVLTSIVSSNQQVN
jgi:hypothetical protein